MSRQFNGDLSELIERGWKNYGVLSQAPPQLKLLSDAVISMIGVLRLTNDAIRSSQLSATDQWVINGQKEACTVVFEQLEGSIYSLKSHQPGFDVVAASEGKILDQVGQLSSFLEILQGPQRQKISTALSKVPNIQSVATNWKALTAELQKFGISENMIQDSFFFIDGWLKENVAWRKVAEPFHDIEEARTRVTTDLPAINTNDGAKNDEWRGYRPGAKRGTIEEKILSLEQTTIVMNHSKPIEFMATPSKAPPAYSFEEGHDGQFDQDFTKYIQHAINAEASRRLVERISQPDAGPQAFSWLPKLLQSQYKDREDVISMLEPDSFSVMAYETAPKCNAEIDRLTSLLRSTFVHRDLSQDHAVVYEAFKCLESMSKAVSKFMLLQDQRSAFECFSDLDTLEFECTTAAAFDDKQQFPKREFEYCQKIHYRLLTYIMGLLESLSFVCQGRTHVTRSRHEFEYLWKDKKMHDRVAWIDKQLAAWDEVEQAVIHCRDWHKGRPFIREQAFRALKDWQKAEKILSGSEFKDAMELTVISASGLPKPTFGRSTLMAKVTIYVANRTGGQMRACELKTDVVIVPRSQGPVWNKTFNIHLPKDPKTFDVEIFDRVAGLETHVGRTRLLFSFIPGLEANFANRSLMYGLDEELDFPISLPIGKGKQTVSPAVKLRLKWAGRQARVEESMLPRAPPGKMFKQNCTGIPLSRTELSAVNDTSELEGSGTDGRAVAEGAVNVTLGAIELALS